MTRTPFRTAAALLSIVLVGTVAACGSDDADPAPASAGSTAPVESPSESPAQTPADPDADGSDDTVDSGHIAGEGYSYAVPAGWEDGTERFRAMSPLLDTGALDTDTGTGFADNVNVIRNDTYPEMGLDAAEEQFVEEASAVSEQVRVRERTELGGQTAIHLSGLTVAAKQEVRTEQYSLYRDGAWYIVTFSFGKATPEAQAQADIGTVLESWQWD